ncbi:MAG: TPM domain-containing protein [Culturomica sp.]|jgi:uncharacterized protein|nr:TPM domain-containing protein [Culturomica sp.]
MARFLLLSGWLLAGLLACTLHAQNLPDPVTPPRMVNDLAGLFSAGESEALEQKLRTFNDTSSTQISVATVTTLDGYDPNDYAQRLAEKWGVGQKGKDNGVLVLIKPKSNREKGEVAIAVGYGLEGVIPDALASRIIRNELIPEFQAGNYYKGVDRAVTVLMRLSSGEFSADRNAGEEDSGSPLWVFLVLFLFFMLLSIFHRRNGSTTNRAGSTGAPFIFFGGGGRGNSFGSFSRGGGGFGGFGGGSFGGGGASGSW